VNCGGNGQRGKTTQSIIQWGKKQYVKARAIKNHRKGDPPPERGSSRSGAHKKQKKKDGRGWAEPSEPGKKNQHA